MTAKKLQRVCMMTKEFLNFNLTDTFEKSLDEKVKPSRFYRLATDTRMLNGKKVLKKEHILYSTLKDLPTSSFSSVINIKQIGSAWDTPQPTSAYRTIPTN